MLLMFIFNQPIKKALPAVTSSTNSGEGLSWLSQMITACAGSCSYDYINLVSLYETNSSMNTLIAISIALVRKQLCGLSKLRRVCKHSIPRKAIFTSMSNQV